jgi:hypothetical protein
VKPLGGNREGASKRQRGSGGFSRDVDGDLAGLLVLSRPGAFARVGVRETDPPIVALARGFSRTDRARVVPLSSRPGALPPRPPLVRRDRTDGRVCVCGAAADRPPRLRARSSFRGGLAAQFFPPFPETSGRRGPQPYPSAQRERVERTLVVARRARRVSPASPRSGTSRSGRRRRGTARVAGWCEPAVLKFKHGHVSAAK